MQSDHVKEDELSEPLFENSSVSMLQAYFMIFQFALKHHLSSKAFSELLLLLKTLLPGANSLPKSIYLFKSFFLKAFPHVEVCEHHYCQDCRKLLNRQLDKCSNALCSCARSERFITVSIGPSLVQMMQGVHIVLS